MDDKLLGIYLNDHLAGARAGLELAKRAAGNNQDTPLGAELETLVADIAEDLATLEDLMDSLGIPKNAFKQALGWFAEKAGRLKLNGRIFGYSPLSQLIEIEGLSLGVNGKLSLWTNLEEVAGFDPKLATLDLDRLIERARAQIDRLEKLRLEAARDALTL